MSAITLQQARDMVAALMAAQSTGTFQSVSYKGRTITYKSAQDTQAALDYWIRMVTQMERRAAGMGRSGISVADFRSRR